MQETASSDVATSPSRFSRALPFACALASTLVLIVPVMNPRTQLFYRDTQRLYYPLKQYIAERLSRGEIPLWDPWTESGISLLGQISPGIFHPFNLLFLLLPFELAFKLNHLLALPLAAAGAYWLARKLSTERWPSAAAGITFGGSGYLVSTTASNLPYALGPASIPAACAGLLWLCERPSAKRLLGAGTLLALCNYSGEPESALFAAAIGGACALGMSVRGAELVVRAQLRSAARAIGLTALWATVALLLSLPAVLPGGLRAHNMSRWNGVSAEEQALFLLSPLRLPALLVPLAFDDSVQEDLVTHWPTPYWEYLSSGDRASFADSICLGAPAMLLALFAFFTDRRGRWLALGGLVFMLGATGEALGIEAWLARLLPGLSLFRYTEKLIGPASLLLALAAARGADHAFGSIKRAAVFLLSLSASIGLALLGFRAWLAQHAPLVEDFLRVLGRTHAPTPATETLSMLDAGLQITATLSLTLALIALLRAASSRRPQLAAALGAACCFAAVMTYASDLLFTMPLEDLRRRPELLEQVLRRAGPSENRWRILPTAEPMSSAGTLNDNRWYTAARLSEVLAPQIDSLFRLESAAVYFSLPDEQYMRAFGIASQNFGALFDVRFVVASGHRMNSRTAKEHGFERVAGEWLRQNPPRPRAFLVARAVASAKEGPLAVMADPSFDPGRVALIDEADDVRVGTIGAAGADGEAEYKRASPERIEVATSAPQRRLLIVAEHFDPGWRATIDGQEAQVLRADIAAIAVPVPAGNHRVLLRFVPQGLIVGMWISAATLLTLLLASRAPKRQAASTP